MTKPNPRGILQSHGTRPSKQQGPHCCGVIQRLDHDLFPSLYESASLDSVLLNYGKPIAHLATPISGMKRNVTSASLSYSSSLTVGPPRRDKSLVTHWICSRSSPTAKGVTSAVVMYCKTAPAIKHLSSGLISTPEGPVRDKEGGRLNMGFAGGRVDHSYGVCRTFDGTTEGATALRRNERPRSLRKRMHVP